MILLKYLGFAFLGFLVGTIITCIILVKKNGKQYVEMKEKVHEKYTAPSGDGEDFSEEETEVPDLSE